MSEQPRSQIRSYHRAHHFELELYTLGNIRLWRPVPARGLFYLAATEVLMLALAHTPGLGAFLSQIDWSVLYVAIPVVLTWLLTVAKIEGRRFHVAVRAWTRHLCSGKRLVGAYRRVAWHGGRWRPAPVVVIGDGRDGRAPQGLRLEGPGAVPGPSVSETICPKIVRPRSCGDRFVSACPTGSGTSPHKPS